MTHPTQVLGLLALVAGAMAVGALSVSLETSRRLSDLERQIDELLRRGRR